MVKKILLIAGVVVVAGLSGIAADRFIFPHLASKPWFSKSEFLKRSLETTTVINKTEQIFMKEEATVNKITGNNTASIVNIISYSEAPVQAKSNSSSVAPKNSTGVIVTSDGLIMTYAPAINTDASKYKILTSDGGSFDAELAGIDSYSNLAFLKISASNLPTISFANSDDENPGEKIIAIGNDQGDYQNIFSSGLLSSFNTTFNISGKTVSSSEKLEGVFELDINSGAICEGGPVINYAGQTVGIAGSVLIDGSERPFVIPSNKVKKVIDRAIRKELGQNPALGIYYTPVTRSLAIAKKIPESKGAMIYSPSGQQGLAVIADSPAARSGLRINDIITKVNGEEVSAKNSLSNIIYSYKTGETLEFAVIRDGAEIKLPVKI